ncbi:serine/threonine protein kinase [Actinocorallia libanotica]|uniref:Protein kinase domain-containing protein n=1 Tax=Actinocorallia libanotica TaxID=46162 RepID=A0ABN1RSW6_9ACTN
MRSTLLPGDPDFVAGYPLHARLGTGGMGDVFLSCTPSGRPIAIKVVRPEFAGDPEFRRRFRREITAAQLVKGIYTAAVLDSDPDAPVPWLATAYVPGPSLHQAVTEHGPLPPNGVLRLMAGVSEALEAIHEVGLIHRDLKPANVLLAQDGPRVIDFGIARAAEATSATRSDVLIGTPMFMAPEQINGHPVTPATDVFALGQLLVFASTGRAAFGEGNRDALFFRILQNEPDLDGCPEDLRDIITRCLAKDPADRPAVDELIQHTRDLLPDLAQTSVPWLPPSVVTSFKDYEPPALTERPVTTGFQGASAKVTGRSGVSMPPPTASPRRASPRPLGVPVVLSVALAVALTLAGAVFFATRPDAQAAPGGSLKSTKPPAAGPTAVTETAPTPSITVLTPDTTVPVPVATTSAPTATKPPAPLHKDAQFTAPGGDCHYAEEFMNGISFTEKGPDIDAVAGDSMDYDLYYLCRDSDEETYLWGGSGSQFATVTGEPSLAACLQAMDRFNIAKKRLDETKIADTFCIKNIDGTLMSWIKIVRSTGGDSTTGPQITFAATIWPLN